MISNAFPIHPIRRCARRLLFVPCALVLSLPLAGVAQAQFDFTLNFPAVKNQVAISDVIDPSGGARVEVTGDNDAVVQIVGDTNPADWRRTQTLTPDESVQIRVSAVCGRVTTLSVRIVNRVGSGPVEEATKTATISPGACDANDGAGLDTGLAAALGAADAWEYGDFFTHTWSIGSAISGNDTRLPISITGGEFTDIAGSEFNGLTSDPTEGVIRSFARVQMRIPAFCGHTVSVRIGGAQAESYTFPSSSRICNNFISSFVSNTAATVSDGDTLSYTATLTNPAPSGGASLTVRLTDSLDSATFVHPGLQQFIGGSGAGSDPLYTQTIFLPEGENTATFEWDLIGDDQDHLNNLDDFVVAAVLDAGFIGPQSSDVPTVLHTTVRDDIAAFVVTPSQLQMPAGDTRVFSMRLGSEPRNNDDVSVVFSIGDFPAAVTSAVTENDVISFTPTTLTFTPSNWGVPQNITVAGSSVGTARITYRGAGGGYSDSNTGDLDPTRQPPIAVSVGAGPDAFALRFAEDTSDLLPGQVVRSEPVFVPATGAATTMMEVRGGDATITGANGVAVTSGAFAAGSTIVVTATAPMCGERAVVELRVSGSDAAPDQQRATLIARACSNFELAFATAGAAGSTQKSNAIIALADGIAFSSEGQVTRLSPISLNDSCTAFGDTGLFDCQNPMDSVPVERGDSVIVSAVVSNTCNEHRIITLHIAGDETSAELRTSNMCPSGAVSFSFTFQDGNLGEEVSTNEFTPTWGSSLADSQPFTVSGGVATVRNSGTSFETHQRATRGSISRGQGVFLFAPKACGHTVSMTIGTTTMSHIFTDSACTTGIVASLERVSPTQLMEATASPFQLAFRVRLSAAAPAGGVIAEVAISDQLGGGGVAHPGLLRFGIAPADYTRTVTVAAGATTADVIWPLVADPRDQVDNPGDGSVDRMNRLPAEATLTRVSFGTINSDSSQSTQSVIIVGAETAGYVVTPDELRIQAGATGLMAVQLASEPFGTATVTVSTDSPAILTSVTPATLTFTPSNWGVPQTLTIATASDAGITDGASPLNINFAGSGGNYGAAQTADDTESASVFIVAGSAIPPTLVTLNANDVSVNAEVTEVRLFSRFTPAPGALGTYEYCLGVADSTPSQNLFNTLCRTAGAATSSGIIEFTSNARTVLHENLANGTSYVMGVRNKNGSDTSDWTISPPFRAWATTTVTVNTMPTEPVASGSTAEFRVTVSDVEQGNPVRVVFGGDTVNANAPRAETSDMTAITESTGGFFFVRDAVVTCGGDTASIQLFIGNVQQRLTYTTAACASIGISATNTLADVDEEDDTHFEFAVTVHEGASPQAGTEAVVVITGADAFVAEADRVQTVTIPIGGPGTHTLARFPIVKDDVDDTPDGNSASVVATLMRRATDRWTFAEPGIPRTQTAVITEDESIGFEVVPSGTTDTPAALPLVDGGMATFTVALTSAPVHSAANGTTQVRVDIGGMDSDAIQARVGGAATATFRADNWNVPQTVAVTTTNTGAGGDQATIALSVADDEDSDYAGQSTGEIIAVTVRAGDSGVAAPTGVSVAPGPGEGTVSWTAGATDSGPPVVREATAFEICAYQPSPGTAPFDPTECTDSRVRPVVGAATSAVFDGLGVTVPIWFAARGVDAGGFSAWVPVAAAVLLPVNLRPPRNVAAVASDDGSQTITVTWDEPSAGSGNFDPDVYNLCVALASADFPSGGNLSACAASATTNARTAADAHIGTYTFNNANDGITDDTDYKVAIRSSEESHGAFGDWVPSSAGIEVTPTATSNDDSLATLRVYTVATGGTALTITPAFPAAMSTTPHTVTLASTDTAFYLTASATDDGASATYSRAPGGTAIALTLDGTTRTAAIAAPAPGASTTVTINSIAEDTTTRRNYTLIVERETDQPASAPSGVVVVVGDEAITVNWMAGTPDGATSHDVCVIASAATNAAAFTDVLCNTVTSGVGLIQVADGSVLTHTRSGLTNGTTYTAAVRARNANPPVSAWVPAGNAVVPNSNDHTPDSSFAFTAETGAEPGESLESNIVTIAGLGGGVVADVVVTGGTISINDGAQVTSGTVVNGNTIAVTAVAPLCSAGTPASASATAMVTVGDVTQGFTITRRACSDVVTLATLTLSQGMLSPAFTAGAAAYTASATVANAVASVILTATPSDSEATIAVTNNGNTVSGDATSGITVNLAEGANAIAITVTSETGMTGTHTITVTRAQPVSPPSGVTVGIGDQQITVTWTAPTAPTVPSGYDVCVIDAGVSNAAAFTSCTAATGGGGTGIIAAATSPHTRTGLMNGTQYTAAVRGTHANGDSVWRPAGNAVTPNSNDNTPESLSFTAMTGVEPSTATTSATETITDLGDGVTVAVSVTGGTVSINGGPQVTSGTIANDGTIAVTVTSPSCSAGTPASASATAMVTVGDATRDFMVTRRACSTVGTLSALMLVDLNNTSVPLSPGFSASATTYTASVENPITRVTLTATPTDSNATIAVTNNDAAISGDATTGIAVSLAEGINSIEVEVTNEVGSSGSTYTVTLNRIPPAPSAPRNLRTSILAEQITMSWAAPTTGGVPTGYDVCRLDAPTVVNDTNCTGNALTALPAGILSHQYIGLTNGTTYNVGVRAKNDQGGGMTGIGPWASTSATPNFPALSISADQRGFYLDDDDGAVFTVSVGQPFVTGRTALTATVTLAAASGAAHTVTDYFTSATAMATFASTAARNATATFTFNEIGEDAAELLADIEVTATATMTDTIGTATTTVTIGPEAPGADVKVVEESSAAVARAVASIANAAIASRIAQVNAAAGGGTGGAPQSNLAQTATRVLTAQQRAQQGDRASGMLGDGMKSVLDGSIIALPYSNGSGGGGARPAMWISGDYRDIGGGDDGEDGADGGTDDDFDWDGEVVSVQLGADVRTANGTLLGAAVSSSQGDIEYTIGDDSGEQQLSLVSFHPYIGWRAGGGSDMWMTASYGNGELESTPEGGDTLAYDATMAGAAFGASTIVGGGARGEMRVNTEFSSARMTIDGAGIDEADVNADAHRVRVSGQWSTTARRGDMRIRRAIEAGARWDGGDGTTGGGAELAYSTTFDNARGTSIALRARGLLAHTEDYEEWGVSAIIRHAPQPGGHGLSLRLEPNWGASDSSVERLVREGVTELTPSADDPAATMNGEIAYGFAYREGVMTPYSGFRLHSSGNDYRIGTRYQLRAAPLEMGVEAYLNEGNERAVDQTGVRVTAEINW